MRQGLPTIAKCLKTICFLYAGFWTLFLANHVFIIQRSPAEQQEQSVIYK